MHASRYAELAPLLTALIPGLEIATRTADTEEVRQEARDLLGDTYQATAAMMVKIGETDAAWIAADRAGFCAETAGSPLAVAASMFRMAHVFLALGQIDQAHHVAATTAAALEPKATTKAEPEILSLYGALHLVLAVAAARDNKRREAREHLKTASEIADRLGEDRDDYGTEFGPTNVAIHTVSIAVGLGDAGQAIELANQVDPASLSPERQARFLLDVAQAHAMRRQIGEALHALQRSRAHRTRGNSRPLRRPSRNPRAAPALRPTPAARTPRPCRTIRCAPLETLLGLHCRIELYLIKAAPLRSAATRRQRRLCLDGPPTHAGSARAAGHLIHTAHLGMHKSVSDA